MDKKMYMIRNFFNAFENILTVKVCVHLVSICSKRLCDK